MFVSVVMPAYNAEKYLAEALDSIFSQTYRNFEVIVVNDGSSDATGDILAKYQRQWGNQLVVISQKNQGQVVAKNKGLQVAKGELIAFIDSDDKWAAEKIERQIQALMSKTNIGLCYTEADLIDQDGRKFGYRQVDEAYRGKCFEKLIMRNNITASSVLLKRKCLEKVGCFDERLRTCENWDLWLRIARSYELVYLRQPLTAYRVHSGHMSGDLDKMRNGKLAVLEKNRLKLPDNLYKEAMFQFHFGYARDYLWQLKVKNSRRDLIQAIKLKPTSLSCYQLLLKSFLGPRMLAKIRTCAG